MRTNVLLPQRTKAACADLEGTHLDVVRSPICEMGRNTEPVLKGPVELEKCMLTGGGRAEREIIGVWYCSSAVAHLPGPHTGYGKGM